MNIVAPISSSKYIDYLVNSPAKEFYCGIVPKEWSDRFGYAISPNRREWKECNLLNYGELANVCRAVHNNGKEIYVTFNANQYNYHLFPYLKNIIKKSIGQGIDGIIVADMGLLLKLIKWEIGIPIVLSGDFGIYNTFSISLLQDFNIKKVIFPRYTTLAEIESFINKFPEFKYEAFLLNERCDFCGAYCFATHGYDQRTFCVDWELSQKKIVMNDDSFDYDSYKEYLDKLNLNRQWKMIDEISRTYPDSEQFGAHKTISGNKNTFCGLCAIEKLRSIGVDSLKVVGRGQVVDELLYLIKLVDLILSENLDSSDIQKLYHMSQSNHFEEYCQQRIFCYYPEFGGEE